MAKPKIKASQVKGVAAKAGAPTTPPVRVQTPDQIKKQAQARAKARMKMLLRALVVLVVIAVIALVVYFVKFYGRMPEDTVKRAVSYAYSNNVVKFKQQFTTDSITLVENGDENNTAPWEKLMASISPMLAKPKVQATRRAEIEEKNNKKYAKVKVLMDGETRVINMREENGKWLINLNVAIDPHHLTLPEEIPEEYIQNFSMDDADSAWWEVPQEEEKKGGFLSKFKCSGSKIF